MSELGRLEVNRDGGVCVLRILGEVDMSNASELLAAVGAAVPNDVPCVVVDLAETVYLDSAGVQVLFALAGRLHARRHQVSVVVPQDSPIRAVLELTGLSTVVPVRARMPPPDPTEPAGELDP